jgi:hypothetical protein
MLLWGGCFSLELQHIPNQIDDDASSHKTKDKKREADQVIYLCKKDVT